VHRYELDRDLFEAFLHSMRMDLHVTKYATCSALAEYIYGSACVIGLQILPVLGTVADRRKPQPSPRRSARLSS
jgi:phytoene synthase